MSTLVSILLAIVMNTLSGGVFNQELKAPSKLEIAVSTCEGSLQNFECHYIIKDEQLFQTK